MILLPFLFIAATLGRVKRKRIDVGLGPEPLINNIYHKQALELYGYTAQTFVSDVYFITDKFDVRGDKIFPGKYPRIQNVLSHLYLFILTVLRYRCIYIYFDGGPLGVWTSLLWRIEPFLYKLAKVKVVVMPYGSDVQDMSRSRNLLFKNAISREYPKHRFLRSIIASKIDLWTKYADHVIGGCEWVYYMYHWDTLMLAHFSIDVEAWKPPDDHCSIQNEKIRILHAPNHKAIKGTRYFIDTINELIKEGIGIELILLEKVPNDEVKKVMATVDVVADQLIVGWYAMFAIEAMAMEKPVLCYLREDLKELYTVAGLIVADEIPIINCSPLTVKEAIKNLAINRDKLQGIGRRSREYVIKHHSTRAVGKVFDGINHSIGLRPSGGPF
jgi:glycosyltransferase involved in cell wall biosynthesis